MRTLLAIIGALVLATIPLFPASAAACTFTSKASGNWDGAGTWDAVGSACGAFPGASIAGDTVVISAGDTVTVNVTPPAADTLASVTVSGTLNYDQAGINLPDTGSLTVASGGVVKWYRSWTVTGATTISGTVNFGSTNVSGRDMTFGDNVTLNSGAVWTEPGAGNGANNNYYFGGSFTNNATTFTAAGTGPHTFSGTGAIAGTTANTFNNISVGATLTNSGTLTVNTTLAGAGTLVNAATGTFNFGGASITPTLTATAVGNTVNYNAAGAQTVKPTTYDHLILSGSGAKSVATGFTITNGNGNLSIAPTGTATLNMGTTNFSVTSLTLGGLGKGGGITYGSLASGAVVTDDTYFTAGATGKLAVSKSTQGITFSALPNKAYGDPDFTVTATASSGLTVTFSTTTTSVCTVTSGGTVHVAALGTCTIDADQPGNVSYIAAPRVSRSFTVNPRTINVTANAKSKVYGEADPALTYSHDPLIGADTFSGGLTRVAGEDVGSYAITQGTLALSSNYTINFTGANLSITPKPINVTAQAKSKVYGAGDPPLTYTSDPLLGTDAFSGALARAAGEDVGLHAITQGTLTAGTNYTINFTGADLTITPKAINVTAQAKSKVYGAGDPPLTYTHDALAFSDTFSGALTRAAGEDVGNYAITQGSLTAGTNYTINFTGADLTITPKAINVAADAKSKVYGEADPPLTYTHDALAFSDAFTGALTRAVGEDVGLYDITQGTLALSSNYTLSFTGAKLEITPKTISVTADAKSKVYGDVDPTPTYTHDALIGSDTFSGALARTAGENVGSYAITQGTLTAGANYSITFTSADLTITKKALVQGTVDDKTITAGDPDPAFTVTYAGLVGSDTFASIDTPPICGVAAPHSTAGNYTIHCNGSAASDNNYDLSGVVYTDGTLHVLPAAAPGFSASPASWYYGIRKIGTTTAKVFTITNNGTADLIITTVKKGGTNPGQFLISNNTCAGKTVHPSGTCSLTVAFNPVRKGLQVAQIVFTDNAGGHTIALSGRGGAEQVVNGGFNVYPSPTAKIPTSWQASLFSATDGKNTTFKKEGTASIRISNTAVVNKTLTQTRLISGTAGTTFQLGVWVKGQSIPALGTAKVEVRLYNGTKLVQPAKVIAVPSGTYFFSQRTVGITATGAFNKVVIILTYAKKSGTVWFDAVSLLRAN